MNEILSSFVVGTAGLLTMFFGWWVERRRKHRQRENAGAMHGAIRAGASKLKLEDFRPLDDAEKPFIDEAEALAALDQAEKAVRGAANGSGKHEVPTAPKKDTTVGPRLLLIGALLPSGEEWRIEEMMNHRNELRAEGARLPRFHHMRLLFSALEIRWEARAYPERRVD